MNLEIENKGLISNHLHQNNLFYFAELLLFLKSMPYGRNTQRENPLCLLSEGKGTCSTKHGLIKLLAEEQNWTQIKLILCIYKMKGENTPAVAEVLNVHQLTYLPEAHCYVMNGTTKIDITTNTSDFASFEKDILHQTEISVPQLGDYKVHFHQNFLREWLEREKIPFSFEEVWAIRESCIKALENQYQP